MGRAHRDPHPLAWDQEEFMPAPPGLHDSFAEDGLWWLDGYKDDQIGGTLTFDPEDGAVLKLLGFFGDLTSALQSALGGQDHHDYPTIFGVTTKGNPVTLFHGINTSRQLNMPGVATETWKSNLLVIGAHLPSEDAEEIFSKSYLRFSSIERWLEHKPFSDVYDHDEKSLTVKAIKPREVHFARHQDFEVTSVGSLYYDRKLETRFTIDVTSQLAITPQVPRSLTWHLSTAVRLQELAALCMGHYIPLTSLELRGLQAPSGGRSSSQQIHVYTQMMHAEAERRPSHEPPVISGPELIAFNPQAVQLWFDQHALFSPAINLFFTVTGQRQMFTNVRLLLAIQALEVFHRRTSLDSVMPAEEFPAFAAALTDAVPPSASPRMKDKLKGAYRFLNEPSLGQRLQSIIDDLGEAFGAKPPAFTKSYLRKLVDTRNYYTHFSEDLVNNTLDGAGMYWASRRIVLLLTLLFLRRLEIPAGDIATLLKRHREFSRLWAGDKIPV
jgi:hypothetical protein